MVGGRVDETPSAERGKKKKKKKKNCTLNEAHGDTSSHRDLGFDLDLSACPRGCGDSPA